MRVGIIGSRTFKDYDLLKRSIFKMYNNKDISFIVSGGASGADSLGELFADEYKIAKMIFRPNWQKHGKAAGFIRNSDIINNSDVIFAFWDGKSKGTADSINKANKRNIIVNIVYF